jgi:uncharacterized membrane protein YkvA (DUF1232 family)
MNKLNPYEWYKKFFRNPKTRWLTIAITILYLFLPFDFLPEFIPIIGFIDDGVLLTVFVTELLNWLNEKSNTK